MSAFVGRIVVSLCGHDNGRLYLVVGEENEYLFLADGKIRRLQKPKRKKIKHIRPILPERRCVPAVMTDGCLRRWLRESADLQNRIIN
ncbi:MAG: KOW domain-containing RNA-binding protein [Clostridia bacterium]|nr:KOW domain-containing RNA-binding protein [Clostridia bacterium]